jgi:hypothetical protein
MLTFASHCTLTLSCFLLVAPAPCPAHECKSGTASAPLHVAAGGGQGCSHIVEVKVCAPAGKAVKSSSVRDLSASPSDNELRNVDGGCVQATVTVRARNVIGPPIWQFCSEGSYEGRAELIYCR